MEEISENRKLEREREREQNFTAVSFDTIMRMVHNQPPAPAVWVDSVCELQLTPPLPKFMALSFGPKYEMTQFQINLNGDYKYNFVNQ